MEVEEEDGPSPSPSYSEYIWVTKPWVAMEPFSFASSEAVDIPVNIRMSVTPSTLLGLIYPDIDINILIVSALKENRPKFPSRHLFKGRT